MESSRVFHPQVGRQFAGVHDAFPGSVGRGHQDPQDVFRTQGLDRQAAGDRGVHPSGEPHHSLAEAALPEVVPQTQNQGLAHRGDGLLGHIEALDTRLPQIHGDHRFLKGGQDRDGLPVPVQGHAAAVEDEFVVAPHLVQVHERQMVAPGVITDQPVPQLLFVHLEG